jgi:two-component sensor histidine kinase
MATDNKDTAIVESQPNNELQELTLRSLMQRIRQQEILAELGVMALHSHSFNELLGETVRLTAEGLRAEFCKVLEYLPADDMLLVKTGVGWNPGVVGIATVGADLASPAGFALRTGKPVISNHLENEDRFRTPQVLADHKIKRAMNVILQGDGQPYGVLEVDSKTDDKFVEHDLAFLQGAANILGMAIERERRERQLKTALERQNILMKEMNHRVKNSLGIVASMLNMQARETDNLDLTEKFDEASRRVSAVARAHERLYRSHDIETVDLGIYLEDVCKDMDTSVAHCQIKLETHKNIVFPIDKSISIALTVVELITNCAKYAYPENTIGIIWVTLKRIDPKNIVITVRDEGQGLPLDFDPRRAKGLGMRIISAFAHQLSTSLTFNRLSPGTEVSMQIPQE